MNFNLVYILGLFSTITEFASCFLFKASSPSDVNGFEEWGPWTVVNTQSCLRLRTRHCSNTTAECSNNKEFSLCPELTAAPHWEEWGPLQCKVTSGTCIIARARNCSIPTLEDCKSTEMNKEIHFWGDIRTCPCREGVAETTDHGTGQWEDWSGWKCQKLVDSCYIFRTRQCSVPDTKDCPPKDSSQLKLWEETCPCGQESTTAMSPVSTTPGVSSPTNTNVSQWLDWGEWKCHKVDFGCMQSRWRQCPSNANDCIGDHFDLGSCNQTNCTDDSRNNSSTQYVPTTDIAVQQPTWSEWGKWECHDEQKQIMCVLYRYRHCINGSETDCDATGGKSYDMKNCNDTCKGLSVKTTTTELPDASATSISPSGKTTPSPSFISVVTKSSVTSYSPSSVTSYSPSSVASFTKSPVTSISPSSTSSFTPIYWMEWTGWDCQYALGQCLMKNTRNCSNYVPDDCEEKIGGPHYELKRCRKEICPAQWLPWGKWRCKMGNRGSCNMTRTRECSTGSIDGCGRNSSMTRPCEKQICPDVFDLQQSGRCSGFNASSCTDVASCSLIKNMNELICQFKDTASDDCPKACGCCEEEPYWLQWSVWECYLVPNNTCRMKRTRSCSSGFTQDCQGMSETVAVCSSSICLELIGLNVDCKDYDSYTMKCEDDPGCHEFKPYLSSICNEPREAAKCPVSCGCCVVPTQSIIGPSGTTTGTTGAGSISNSTPNTTGIGGTTNKISATGGTTTQTNTGPIGTVGTTKITTGIGGLTNIPSGTGGTTKSTTGIGGATNLPSGTGGTTKLTTGIGGSTNIPSGIGGTTKNTTGIGGLTNIPSGTGGTTKSTTGIGGSTNLPSGTGETTKITTGIGGSTNIPSGTGGTTKSTTGIGGSANIPSGTGGTTKSTTGIGGSTIIPSGTGGTTKSTIGIGVATNIPSGTGGTTESTTGIGGSTNIPSGTVGTTKGTTGISGSTNIQSGTGGSTKITTGIGGSTNIPSGTGGTTKITTAIGGSTNIPTGTGGTTKITTGSTNIPGGTDRTTKITTAIGGSTNIPNGTGGTTESTTGKGATTNRPVDTGSTTKGITGTGGASNTTKGANNTSQNTNGAGVGSTGIATMLTTTASPVKTTTHKPPYTIPPIPTTCKVCSGPAFLCEKLYVDKTCAPPNNYCINKLSNHKDGTRTVTRDCGTFDTCYRDWFLGSSDSDKCRNFEDNNIITLDFDCTYCCIDDGCNESIRPSHKTLYKDL